MHIVPSSPSKSHALSFRVGAVEYLMSITPGPLLYAGEEVLAISLQRSRDILIAGEVEPRDRLRVLLRELLAVWVLETGGPDSYDLCGWRDLAATMAMAAMHDLAAQGGPSALEAMAPDAAFAA